MKLVYGETEYKLGWRDGCFAGGVLLVAGGLASSFGWGVVVAAAGLVMMLVPWLTVAKQVPEETVDE